MLALHPECDLASVQLFSFHQTEPGGFVFKFIMIRPVSPALSTVVERANTTKEKLVFMICSCGVFDFLLERNEQLHVCSEAEVTGATAKVTKGFSRSPAASRSAKPPKAP